MLVKIQCKFILDGATELQENIKIENSTPKVIKPIAKEAVKTLYEELKEIIEEKLVS